MRILLTGHDGYIGHVLTPLLLERGHEVTGLDSCLYEGCGFDTGKSLSVPVLRKDVREIELEDLPGFDAVQRSQLLSGMGMKIGADGSFGIISALPH